MNAVINAFRVYKINDQLPMVYFILTSLSIDFFLYSGPISRNIYYILTYISVIYFIVLVVKVDKKIHLYVLPTLFLMVGVSKLVWLGFTSNPQFPLVAYHYEISGKRMLLGYFILYCIQRNLNNWRFSRVAAAYSSYLLFALLIVISLADSLQYLKSGVRIKVNSDSATSGAYILVLFSMITIYCLRNFVTKLYRPFCLIAIALTFLTLLATETRSALIFYTLFVVFCLVHELMYGKKNHKRVFASAILVLGLCALSYGKVYYHPALERMDAIRQEATQYMHGQNSTSLGARLSLWKSAWFSFEHHPLGQSADSRNGLATQYIQQYESGNQEALNNVQYHMHNDILDSLSLQGIFGGMLMLALFLALLFYPFVLFNSASAFLLLSLPVVFFSQGDCQFYNRESPYFFILVLGFLMMLRLVAKAPRSDSALSV